MLIPLLTAGLLAAAPFPVYPEPLPQRFDPAPHALQFDWTRDGAITAVGAALWIGTETFFKDRLAPEKCRWCGLDAQGRPVLNPLDAFGRRLNAGTPHGRARASLVSDVLDFGLLPMSVFGMQYALARPAGGMGAFRQDAFIIVQSVVLSSVATQAVKFAVGRQRPYAQALAAEGQPLPPGSDHHLSFFSGHTSLAFSMAVSAGVTAELRGYRDAWLVWAVGMPLASAVPLLRMAADKHYLTDVAMGAAVGSAFGIAVPLLLHGRRSAESGSGGGLGAPGGRLQMELRPLPTGFSFSGTF